MRLKNQKAELSIYVIIKNFQKVFFSRIFVSVIDVVLIFLLTFLRKTLYKFEDTRADRSWELSFVFFFNVYFVNIDLIL